MGYRLDEIAPLCEICDQPLTDNDRDPETWGYYSRHFACYTERRGGRYVVVSTYRARDLDKPISAFGYTTARMARWKVDELARSNNTGWRFWVLDRETGEILADSFTVGQWVPPAERGVRANGGTR